VQRATRADERAYEVEVCARVDEEPGILLPEAERPELREPPLDDAAVLEGDLFVRWSLLGRGNRLAFR
jgi:hypothetical protein